MYIPYSESRSAIHRCLRETGADDGKYHVIPTVSPENWGCTVDFRLNQDCIMDLALIDFLMQAVVEASRDLEPMRTNAQDVGRESGPSGADYPRARILLG